MVDPPADPEMGVLEESEIYRRFLRTYEENPRSLTMKPLPEVPSRQAMIDEIRSKTAVGMYIHNHVWSCIISTVSFISIRENIRLI